MNTEQQWTEVITPKRSLFDLNLKEVWRYRDLIALFVRRDFVAQYKQTILGPLWFFLGPLFTIFSFTFVFSEIAKISTDGLPGPLFYLAGTTLWNYFQNCFNGTAGTFVSNAGIFGKVYFPRLVAPISVVISNLFKFFLQMAMFMVFWIYYYSKGAVHATGYFLLFPYLVFLMASMGLGLGIIFSSLTTKYRDLNYFIGFGVTLLMYITPIIYPISAIPEIYKPYLFINPIAPIIEAFRFGFTGAGTFSWEGLAYSTGFSALVLFFGILLFNQTEKTFMDTV
jgi:lipopolysaccharide transport system permease protein